MTVIDSHQHYWRYHPQRDAWITDDMNILRRDFLPEDLTRELAAVGVSKCVAVQADQSLEETKFLLSLADKYSFIAGVVGWVDLRSRQLKNDLADLRHDKLKGFRHIIQGEPDLLDDPVFIDGVSMLGHHAFTYDLLIYYSQLDAAARFLSKVADKTSVVIDHLAKPSIRTNEFTAWEKGITVLGQFENVHCKLSGIITEADWSGWNEDQLRRYLDKVFDVFGPSRLMYGSDWPVCLLAGSYRRQWEVVFYYVDNLSESEKALVLGENAKRFYNL